MVGQAMKVHQMASVELWEQESSLSLTCKRLRPLAPKIGHHTLTLSLADLKSFIKPQSAPTKTSLPQSEVQSGGTRWNPTREQIEILEKLYRGGMRTPNAQQIEQITMQLGKYGKIEGKNVFYWFQNHKARERQRQKRVGLAGRPWPLPAELSIVGEEVGSFKKRSRPWVQVEGSMAAMEEEHGLVQTLELFPLRPEGAAS